MASAQQIRMFLPSGQLKRLQQRKAPFFAKMIAVLSERGHRVVPIEATDHALAGTWSDPGYDLVLDRPPMHDKALTMRQCYIEPFWRIEKTEKRWEFEVARSVFSRNAVPLHRVPRFLEYWGDRLGHTRKQASEGFVYVPLQGKLLSTRSFQVMSPIKMVRELLKRQDRPLLLTLHPSEKYTDEEREAVRKLCENPRVQLSTRSMYELLPACDVVATQNSAVALHGFFYERPALLFGKIDFYHIAASVPRDGLEQAIERVYATAPDYGAYLFWFFQMQALNHWRPEFSERLVARLSDHGWSI